MSLGRDYLSEMNIESVCKTEIYTLLHVWSDFAFVNVSLQLIRQQDHDDIAFFGRLGRSHNGEASCNCLVPVGTLCLGNDHIHPTFLEIIGMGMPLASIAHNNYFLLL